MWGGRLNDNVEVYLLADGRGVHPRRLVLTLLQRKLVFGRFSVDGIVEVHAGHVAVQVVPVQQKSALRHIITYKRVLASIPRYIAEGRRVKVPAVRPPAAPSCRVIILLYALSNI